MKPAPEKGVIHNRLIKDTMMKSLFVLLGSALAINAFAATPVVYHAPSQIPMPGTGDNTQAMPSAAMPATNNTVPTVNHHIMPGAQQSAPAPKTMIVQQGQTTITVRLNANATTGYSWILGGYDHSLLTLLSYSYQAPHTQLIGAGGQAVFTFHVNPAMFTGPQVTTLKFYYARAWQYTNQGQAQVVNVISVGSSAGQPAQQNMAAQAGLTTHSTVANPYTPPMQTTNALPQSTTMGAPSTTMPQMHNSAAPVQHSTNAHQQDNWLSLPPEHQASQ
jgi:predicted secreted protein